MRLITIRSQILEVADGWRRQYTTFGDPDKMEILKKLEKLDEEKATAKDVENIIGNGSWVCLRECKECRGFYDAIIEIGETLDFDSYTTYICLKCLKKALKLFKDANDPEYLHEYIELLKDEIADLNRTLPAKWFLKGQESVKRKNKSGCSCIINDDDEIVSVCGAHQQWADSLTGWPPGKE